MTARSLISVVDDDEGVRSSLDGLFRSIGHPVATFGSAEAFLASGAIADSACVVSDVRMPGGMSGLRLAKEIRRAGTPVILISGFVDDRLEREADDEGVLRVLSKPFDPEDLVTIVEEALSEKRRTAPDRER